MDDERYFIEPDDLIECGMDMLLREGPYPTQCEMNAEDARELYRLAAYLKENHDDTRLACEPVVDWAIRLLAGFEKSPDHGKQSLA